VLLLFRFLSVRYWLRHRGAFFLSCLGVALGLAVFVSIAVANTSVLASFSASLDAVTGKTNLQIRGGQNGLPEGVFAQLSSTRLPVLRDNIKAQAPLVQRTFYSPTLQTSLLILGVDLFSESGFRDLSAPSSALGGKQSKELFTFLLDPKAIAISSDLAKRHNLKLGDQITVYSGARRLKFRIVSLLDSREAGHAFGGDFALLDIAAAQEAFGQVGRLSQIDLIVDESKLDEVSRAIRVLVPPDAIVQRPAQRSGQVADLLRAFQLNLSALSCISLFVGAFLIYNAIATAVVRRRAEIGTLRALGASRGQMLRLFLLEAALIGIIGSVAGFALGLGLAHFTLRAVSTTVSQLYISVRAQELTVPFWLWTVAPLGGTLLAVLASLPAALEAAGTSPRQALQRVTLHHATARWAWPLAIIGGAFLVVAFVLCLPSIATKSLFAGFASSFFTLGGFALMTPLWTLCAGKIVQRFAGRVAGIEGVLAGTYLQRAINRSSLVIAALMLSLAMSIGLSTMVGSFRAAVEDWVTATVSADLYIAPANGFSGSARPGLPPEVVRFARALPQVQSSDVVRNLRLQINNQPVSIAANELPTLAQGRPPLRILQTVRGEEAARREFVAGRAVLVSERFKNLVGPGAGDTLVLPSPSGTVRFPIAAVFSDYSPDACVVYLPRALYQKYWHDDNIDGIALYLKSQSSTRFVQETLQKRFSSRYQLTILPNRELRDTIFVTFDQTFAVTYALQLIAIIVAAIGIFDTLIALLLERGRELATLRALGASAGQIRKMAYVEFALIGFIAWTIGVFAGLCLAWQLIHVINRQFFGWSIAWKFSPQTLLVALVASVAAAVVAGVWPSYAASRRIIADALQVE